MTTTIQTTDRQLGHKLVSSARIAWYGMRPLWWRSYWGLQVRGLQNLPKNGAMIFCANHSSHLDAAAILAALPRHIALEVTTVAARDVWGGTPLRSFLSRVTTNAVAVDRDAEFAGGLRMLGAVLAENRPIILFPEGRRSFDGELVEFKEGAAMLAIRSGVPIIPIYIDGAHDVMPRGQMWPESGTVRVNFGAPIHPEHFDRGRGREARRQAYTAMTAHLRRTILALKEGK